MYVEYTYYIATYGGEPLPLNDFTKLERKASVIFENYTPTQRKLSDEIMLAGGKKAEMVKLTICELIEAIKKYQDDLEVVNRGNIANLLGVASESVKDHSTSYVNGAQAPTERLNSLYDGIYSNIMKRNLWLTGLLYRGL